MRVNLDTGIPVIFGVLTVKTKEQARARAGLDGSKDDHGKEWAEALILQATHRRECNPKGYASVPSTLDSVRDGLGLAASLVICAICARMFMRVFKAK